MFVKTVEKKIVYLNVGEKRYKYIEILQEVLPEPTSSSDSQSANPMEPADLIATINSPPNNSTDVSSSNLIDSTSVPAAEAIDLTNSPPSDVVDLTSSSSSNSPVNVYQVPNSPGIYPPSPFYGFYSPWQNN